MSSPFPGIDPYVEGSEFFGDFHGSLISALREALNAVMPPGYVATTNYIVWTEPKQKREPDVSLTTHRRVPRSPKGTGGTALAELTATGFRSLGRDTEPLERRQPHLEIIRPKDRRLVTAVEVLSPSNKAAGDNGRKAYLKKQKEFVAARANIVEFDFLRGGEHATAAPLASLVALAGSESPYHASVWLARGRRYFGRVFPLREPLPPIAFPLDRDARPVVIDLQPLLGRVYDTGRYAELLDYAKPPDPPLSADDQAWADSVLLARQTRPEEA